MTSTTDGRRMIREGKDHGRMLRERLRQLEEERGALQDDLELACAALSPSPEAPETDPLLSIVYCCRHGGDRPILQLIAEMLVMR